MKPGPKPKKAEEKKQRITAHFFIKPRHLAKAKKLIAALKKVMRGWE